MIDQAFDKITADDLTAYLESLPSPTVYGGVSPAGVGSQASRTPSTRALSTLSVRTLTPSPSPRTQRRQLRRRRRILTAAGATGGGGGGDSSGGSGGRVVEVEADRDEDEDDNDDLLPWTPPRPSRQATPRGSPRTLNQADLQRRLRILLQDQEQFAQGHEIANITTTNSIVTSYKQGGRPTCKAIRQDFPLEEIDASPKRKNCGVFIEWTVVQTQLFKV